MGISFCGNGMGKEVKVADWDRIRSDSCRTRMRTGKTAVMTYW